MSTALQPIMNTLPITSVDSYIARVNTIPMLTAEQEYNFAKQLRDENDLDAAKQLITPHLRFVVKVARGYLGYGLSLADLIQEGNIGLMKAVKRFDPEMGVRLVSYAVHWIKAEIHEFVLRNWRIVKIATTKAQRKLFFNLRRFKKRLGWFTKEEVEGVAKELGVSTKEVMHMESSLNAADLSYDVSTNDDEEYTAPSYYLEDHNSDHAEQAEAENQFDQNNKQLLDALEQLDERSRIIIARRWLAEKKATLSDLSAEFNVSMERIRQLEQNAMKKLKSCMAIS